MANFPVSSSQLCKFLFKRLGRNLCTNLSGGESALMLDEVLKQLDLKDGHTILDMTFGEGFHTEAILRTNPTVNVIALDRDPHAFLRAEKLAGKYPGRVKPLLGRFSDLPMLLNPLGISRNFLDAIFLDVGCSSKQLNDAGRGFSSEIDGPLDMRMDGSDSSGITAMDVLMTANEHDLARIIRIYGGEEQSKKIAGAIVKCRHTFEPLKSTLQLRDFVRGICDAKSNRAVQNVFYALRTFVNNEFNELNYAMLLAEQYLKKGGRIVSLTFNHLEDLIVKRHITGNVLENNPNPVPLKYYSQSYNLTPDEINELRNSQWSPLTKHVITVKGHFNHPDGRVRKAKLRGAMKL
ncbi:probable methyltransferase-like protein 15 homolog [Thrips palmi]|uniref:Probable methyltransferase-like protein 15 homolog n=1 Tax=Thrips palmi TaxID=161013 RepID=A0A6P8XZR3_THRPL|nr:probable methyltransferase-like protein 15 homolog [Thrips palmi]